MEAKDKDLLLKDLCARLRYGIFANYTSEILFRKSVVGRIYLWSDSGFYIKKTDKYPDNWNYETWTSCEFGTLKPYLRSMESMTEEEAKTFVTLWGIEDFISLDITKEYIGVVCDDGFGSTVTTEIWYDGDMPISCYDLLNARHLDYRGLIKMDLALPAPEGMYDFKQLQL